MKKTRIRRLPIRYTRRTGMTVPDPITASSMEFKNYPTISTELNERYENLVNFENRMGVDESTVSRATREYFDEFINTGDRYTDFYYDNILFNKNLYKHLSGLRDKSMLEFNIFGRKTIGINKLWDIDFVDKIFQLENIEIKNVPPSSRAAYYPMPNVPPPPVLPQSIYVFKCISEPLGTLESLMREVKLENVDKLIMKDYLVASVSREYSKDKCYRNHTVGTGNCHDLNNQTNGLEICIILPKGSKVLPLVSFTDAPNIKDNPLETAKEVKEELNFSTEVLIPRGGYLMPIDGMCHPEYNIPIFVYFQNTETVKEYLEVEKRKLEEANREREEEIRVETFNKTKMKFLPEGYEGYDTPEGLGTLQMKRNRDLTLKSSTKNFMESQGRLEAYHYIFIIFTLFLLWNVLFNNDKLDIDKQLQPSRMGGRRKSISRKKRRNKRRKTIKREKR